MSEAKHTPGPWRVVEIDGGFAPCRIDGADGTRVVDYNDQHRIYDWNDDHGKTWKTLDADASLIAAAPDMLAACGAILSCEAILAAGEGRTSPALDMVRAAVAKAMGVDNK